jgi:hypothetical protein
LKIFFFISHLQQITNLFREFRKTLSTLSYDFVRRDWWRLEAQDGTGRVDFLEIKYLQGADKKRMGVPMGGKNRGN